MFNLLSLTPAGLWSGQASPINAGFQRLGVERRRPGEYHAPVRLRVAFFAVVLGLVAGVGSAQASRRHAATVIEVFPGPNAIQNALVQAVSGDTLSIHTGTYTEHFSVRTTNVTLTSAGDGPVTVDGACVNRWTIQVLADGVTIQGLSLRGGTFGEITFTRTPNGPASAARVRASPTRAILLAA